MPCLEILNLALQIVNPESSIRLFDPVAPLYVRRDEPRGGPGTRQEAGFSSEKDPPKPKEKDGSKVGPFVRLE